MKTNIPRKLFIVLACFIFDLLANGLMGRLFFLATPLAFSYSISFCAPLVVRIVSALLVIMQAQLYSFANIYFDAFVSVLLLLSPFLNKLLRDEPWVRWIVTLFIFLIFAVIAICA